jgi:hypothetical protein
MVERTGRRDEYQKGVVADGEKEHQVHHINSAVIPTNVGDKGQVIGPLRGEVPHATIAMTGGFGRNSNLSSQSIPLDKNAIVQHYAEVTPHKAKRGRSISLESQHEKVHH